MSIAISYCAPLIPFWAMSLPLHAIRLAASVGARTSCWTPWRISTALASQFSSSSSASVDAQKYLRQRQINDRLDIELFPLWELDNDCDCHPPTREQGSRVPIVQSWWEGGREVYISVDKLVSLQCSPLICYKFTRSEAKIAAAIATWQRTERRGRHSSGRVFSAETCIHWSPLARYTDVRSPRMFG